ncbi:MAG TPA: alpha/beta fold hydrolase [Castellaniella sp.]|uniref:alpha/beta fold hydrolase n=1 Tax=Castellaniella sp. TaxID=1955812 RepID=UPI002F0C5625
MTHTPCTYVLVHGAWHGGWCWSRVAERLRSAGHRVFAPTLTGLGERSHLLSSSINLDTFIQDIHNVLIWEDLHDVVLVGHSFGGLVISGVADQLANRIQRLVYLDAFLLPPGISTFDSLPPETVAKIEQRATATGGILPPRPTTLGLEAEEDIRFVQDRLTPHPIGSYRQALSLEHYLGNGLPITHIRCTQPAFPAVAAGQAWAKGMYKSKWRWAELPCSHDAMVVAPDLVAQALITNA